MDRVGEANHHCPVGVVPDWWGDRKVTQVSLGRTGLAGLCAKRTENQGIPLIGPFYGWKGHVVAV